MATREIKHMGKVNNFTKILSGAALLLSGSLVVAGHGWYDGERWRTLHEDPRQVARLELDMETIGGVGSSRVRSVSLQSVESARMQALPSDQSISQVPVFRDRPGGPVRVSVGGVIVRFTDLMSAHDQADWLAQEGLTVIGESVELGWVLVASPPGWPSLDLANRLHEMSEVAQASPNWWRPTTRR
jgi:hypothetical protein